MKTTKELMGLDEAEKMKGEDPCWAGYEMVGMKMKNGKKVPNCVPKAKAKNEEVEITEAKVGDTVSFHHELKSAPGSKVKKSGTVEKVDGDVVHVKVKDKYGVKRHQIKMGDLVKEETEQIDEMDKSAPQPGRDGKVSHRTYGSRDRDDKDDYFKGKESPGKSVTAKQAEKDALKILNKQYAKEETQIDELNKDTLYSYNKKADADVEKKHKSLGQLMRKGDAAGANKAAHQINRRLAGMERAEKRLNAEETEQIDEISAEVKQKYLAAATKKHLQQFLGRAPVRDKQELDKRRAAIQKTSKELTGKTHYQEEVEVEESKKIPANDKPVDPKDLVVSLKDVPIKKPRGHTQYDPSKEFPGVKALKREETELEEAQFWGNKEMAKQANAASGSTTTMRGRDAKGVYTATLVRKKGESEHKEVSRVYDTKEEVEPIDEVSKELANRVSAARRKQADDSSKKDPYLKPSAETVAKKKKADNAHASWIKRMIRDNNRGKTQADISREHAAAADYNSKRGWTNEEMELEEAEEIKKVKMTPQERAYKRKIGLKAISKPVEEAAKVETSAEVTKHFEKGQSTPSGVPKWVAEPLKKKKKVEEASDAELMGGAVSKPTASGNNPKLADKFMKAFRKMKSPANISCKTVGMISTCEDVELDEAAKKKEETPSSKNVKKGEKLSGKQEPIKVNPELQEK